MGQRLKYILVWLRRIAHCRGFGIQSPTDYWFVRYVINEHWPYYQYDVIGQNDDWMTRKMGRLHFRLANWRQPSVITADHFRDYLQGGCKRAEFGEGNELICMSVGGDCRKRLAQVYSMLDENSVIIIENICRDKNFWQEIVNDKRTGVTFDLYYCGIILFDKKRTKKNYIINF